MQWSSDAVIYGILITHLIINFIALVIMHIQWADTIIHEVYFPFITSSEKEMLEL